MARTGLLTSLTPATGPVEQRLQAQMLYFYCVYLRSYLEFTGNEASFLLVRVT